MSEECMVSPLGEITYQGKTYFNATLLHQAGRKVWVTPTARPRQVQVSCGRGLLLCIARLDDEADYRPAPGACPGAGEVAR